MVTMKAGSSSTLAPGYTFLEATPDTPYSEVFEFYHTLHADRATQTGQHRLCVKGLEISTCSMH